MGEMIPLWKVVRQMGNSTFETKETELEEYQEEYRLTFLRYIEVSEKLLELRDEREGVVQIQDAWLDKSGGEYPTETEEFLFKRYGLENSLEGLKRAILQFQVELVDATMWEGIFWNHLACSSSKARCVNWYRDNADGQRILMLEDALSKKRLHFYRQQLSNFTREPDSPEALETVFILEHGRLAANIPFPN